jgi:hypothetical protein
LKIAPSISRKHPSEKTTLVDNPSNINDFFCSEQIFFKENILSRKNKLCSASYEAHHPESDFAKNPRTMFTATGNVGKPQPHAG